MRRNFLRTAAASAAAVMVGVLVPTAAIAAEDPGVPSSDQVWKFPPVFAASYKPGGDFLVGQPFAPTEDGHLYEIDLWIFGIGDDGTPADPVLDSATVYDIAAVDPGDFDLSEPIPGGQAIIGESAPDPDEEGKFRLPLRFENLPDVSGDARYLLVLDHAMGEGGSKASYAIGVEQPPPSAQPIMNNEKSDADGANYWDAYTNGRIWHEVFLVDPIVPLVPELIESETCDVPASVQLPEQAGVEYTVEEDGHIHTVTAAIDDGLVAYPEPDLGPWTFDVTPEPCEDPGDDNGEDSTEDGGSGDENGEDSTEGGASGDDNGEESTEGDDSGGVNGDGSTEGEDSSDAEVPSGDGPAPTTNGPGGKSPMPNTGTDSAALIGFGLAAIALGAIATYWSRRVASK